MALKELVLVGPQNSQNLALLTVLEQSLYQQLQSFQAYNSENPQPGEDQLYLIDAQLLDTPVINCLLEMIEQNTQQSRIALFNLQRKQIVKDQIASLNLHGVFFADDNLEMLLKGLRLIIKQEYWIPRNLLGKMLEHRNSANIKLHQLTNRELQILLLIADGRSNQEIADTLYISTHTVKTHIYNLYKKIGVKSRMRAAIWAERHLSDQQSIETKPNMDEHLKQDVL